MHAVVVGLDLDPGPRSPQELLDSWPDFGRIEAATAGGEVRVTIVQASWFDDVRHPSGIPCHFVREASPIVKLPTGRSVSRVPRRLFTFVRELQPDLLHVHSLGFSRQLWALRAAFPRIPIAAQAHSSSLPRGWRRLYFHWGAVHLDAAIFCTDEQGEVFKQHRAIPAKLPVFEVIEGSTSFTPGDPLVARRSCELTGDPCLFWLGNLDQNKDPLMVLSAVARAVHVLPGLRLYMCYRDAPLLPLVRARIAQDPALLSRVVLLGERTHAAIETYLRAADFLVQGSHREGSGFGVIEALACGTTPLVTNIPSFRRITQDGKYGALVAPGDATALAAEIVAWAQRDRAGIRRLARRQFEVNLSFEAIGHQLRETYARLVRLTPSDGRVSLTRDAPRATG